MLDTREYEVEMPDGSTLEYATNVVAENLYAQRDSERRQFLLLSQITDHKTNRSALKKDNGFVTARNGSQVPRRATKGWHLLVEWKDGSTTWVPLYRLKESNPVEVADYAVANKIIEEPAFAWWAKYILRRRNQIISKVKGIYWRTTHKFGI
jgi:hypothetical protein